MEQDDELDSTAPPDEVESVDDDVDDSVVREFVVPEGAAGQRIDLFLTGACDGYSRSQIRQAVQDHQASVDGRVVRPSFKIRAGHSIQFHLPAKFSDDVVPENIPLDILYEDDGFVVVNKPAGMVVHPARGNWKGTLTSALAYRFQSLSDVGGPTRPGIVHRLDRDTSGVIVIAKTNAVHMALAQQWHDREVEKEYFAITVGRVDRDRDVIDAPIGRHPYQRDKMAIRENHSTSKSATTFYEVTERIGRFSLVTAKPKRAGHTRSVSTSHTLAVQFCATVSTRDTPSPPKHGLKDAAWLMAVPTYSLGKRCTRVDCLSAIRSRGSGSRSKHRWHPIFPQPWIFLKQKFNH